jgi:hypothetical protein
MRGRPSWPLHRDLQWSIALILTAKWYGNPHKYYIRIYGCPHHPIWITIILFGSTAVLLWRSRKVVQCINTSIIHITRSINLYNYEFLTSRSVKLTLNICPYLDCYYIITVCSDFCCGLLTSFQLWILLWPYSMHFTEISSL